MMVFGVIGAIGKLLVILLDFAMGLLLIDGANKAINNNVRFHYMMGGLYIISSTIIIASLMW